MSKSVLNLLKLSSFDFLINNRLFFTMNLPKEKCSFCRSDLNSQLINLFSKSGDSSTYYDKISSSLSQLANILNEIGNNCFICEQCCHTIEMIYEYNHTCMNNIKMYLSERLNLKTESDETEKIFIKIEPYFESTFNNAEIERSNVLREEHVVENMSNLTDICQVVMETDELNIKKENLDNTNNKFNFEESIIEDYSYSKFNSGEKNFSQVKEQSTVFEDSSYISQEHGRSSNQRDIFVQDELVNKSRKRFSCNQCGKLFRHNSHLKRHMLLHTSEKGVKTYTCEVCTKSFVWKSDLDKHILIHTGEKPYSCNECKKAFAQKSHLNRHMLIHTGEKPFQCDTCKKRFREKSTLEGHKLTHSSEKPHICEQCNKSFAQKYLLKIHKRIHTDEKPYS